MQSPSASEMRHLLVAAKQGCQESLGKLLESYRNYLSLIARSGIGGSLRVKCSPSDVVQETYLHAHRAFENFAGATEAELMSWLRQILVSQIATAARRFSTDGRQLDLERRLLSDVERSSGMLAALADGAPPPEHDVARREDAVLLADSLAQLPPHYRDVIVIRHLEGKSIQQTATEMNRSVDSVKGIWQRALGMLGELLEGKV